MIGKDEAKISEDAAGCSFESMMYTDDDGNCFFDTVGLNASVKGTVSAKDAMAGLVKLFKSLESGVNVIVFMIRKGRITETMVDNYTIFVRDICQRKVPVVMAVSGCELDSEDKPWFWRVVKDPETGEQITNKVRSDAYNTGNLTNIILVI